MKQHPEMDTLVLLYYGEARRPEELSQHLAECPECKGRFDALAQELGRMAVPVPEKGPDYGRAVWLEIRNKLPERKAKRFLPAWFVPMLATACLLVVAFTAGRWSRQGEVDEALLRERALLAAVGDHFENTRTFLMDASHGTGADDFRRTWARSLVDDNRLIRQAAWNGGEYGLADFLEELEYTLLETANRQAPAETSETTVLERDEHLEIIFKIRVYQNQMHERGAPANAGRQI